MHLIKLYNNINITLFLFLVLKVSMKSYYVVLMLAAQNDYKLCKINTNFMDYFHITFRSMIYVKKELWQNANESDRSRRNSLSEKNGIIIKISIYIL